MFNFKACAAGVLALALTGAAHATATNYVVDGNFAGGASANGFTTYYGTQTFDSGAWTVGGDSIDLIGSYWQQPTGGYTVDLDGNAPGSISQTLNLTAGEYLLSFLLAGNMGSGNGVQTVNVSVGGVTQSFSFDTTGHSFSSMGYTLETLKFDAIGATTLTFTSGSGGASGAVIGDVSVTAVPEPASLGLLLAGIGMLGVMSSRRRAR